MKITFYLHTIFSFLPFLFPQMYCYSFPSDAFSSFFPDVFSHLPCFSTRSVFIFFFSFLQMYFHSLFHHMCFHSFCFFSSKYNFIRSVSLRQMHFDLFLQMTSTIPSKCICIHSILLSSWFLIHIQMYTFVSLLFLQMYIHHDF